MIRALTIRQPWAAAIAHADKRDKVRKFGNAVTPPVAEVIVSALAEAVTGEPLETAW
ncbi:hypothetical protein ACIHFC_29730 [Streptomyces sp. NPDC052013]|uniref:hypothetical protein n=1 Tax=Streptomyces sp. NPDC052013 TaxID=3365679 RepID=UPI0037D4C8DF